MSKETAKKYYKVKALIVTDKNGKVHRNKSVVDGEQVPTILPEDSFNANDIPTLVKSGFIEEASADEASDAKSDEKQKADRLEELQKKYCKLADKDKAPGNWGIPKLEKEVERLEKEAEDKKKLEDEDSSDDSGDDSGSDDSGDDSGSDDSSDDASDDSGDDSQDDDSSSDDSSDDSTDDSSDSSDDDSQDSSGDDTEDSKDD